MSPGMNPVPVGEGGGAAELRPDTIVARSTPPGRGAMAVIRLSGGDAGRILEDLTLAPLPPPRRAELRALRSPSGGHALDHALVTFFPAPGSYTGEDVVEISTHGGVLVPELVLGACEALGARRATAGEFTRRAYLNGKLDLLQVEAVQDLIEGRSLAGHRAALHQLEGGLSERVVAIRQGLIRLEVLLAHHLDFPDEDEPPTPLSRIGAEATRLRGRVEGLLRLAPEGILLREGALVVLAGPPNAGKSSLFNLLVGEERAIVTPEPGTTRDAVEAMVSFDGFPFRLVDTAGLRDAPGTVEQMGVEVARRYLASAQVVLYCHPADEPWDGAGEEFLEEMGDRPTLLLRTCADRGGNSRDEMEPVAGVLSGRQCVSLRVSSRTGEGVPELREVLGRLVFGGLEEAGEDEPLVTRERHRSRLQRAASGIEGFRRALEEGIPADVAGVHLQDAALELEELVGTVDPEEVLEHLFASFCIGK
jgi:tRNA modification GTPase